MKIHWYLLKLLSGNKNNGRVAGRKHSQIWLNLLLNDPKPEFHNINAHTKFGDNTLD